MFQNLTYIILTIYLKVITCYIFGSQIKEVKARVKSFFFIIPVHGILLFINDQCGAVQLSRGRVELNL